MDGIQIFIIALFVIFVVIRFHHTLVILLKWNPNEVSEFVPKLTVFLPFFNEDSEVILDVLDSLDQQEYCHEIQVIIIDDGSTNDSANHIRSWLNNGNKKHNFTLIQKPDNEGRKGVALDYALELGIATGDVYIVIDSDTHIEPNAMHLLATKLWSDERYAAVCGYIVPTNRDKNFLSRSQFYEYIGMHGAERTAQDQFGSVTVMAGAFVAHRASVVKEIGGWSSFLVEDISWCWKALAKNYRTGYEPNAIAYTVCPTENRTLFRQRRRWSRGRVEAFSQAWKTSVVRGLLSTPLFLYTAAELLIPPTIVLVPLLYFTSMPLAALSVIVALISKTILNTCFFIKSGNKLELSITEMFSMYIYIEILQVVTWLPNLLGYFDEIVGAEKKWLTR